MGIGRFNALIAREAVAVINLVAPVAVHRRDAGMLVVRRLPDEDLVAHGKAVRRGWYAAGRGANRGVALAVGLLPLAAVAVRAAGGCVPAVALAELLARHGLRLGCRREDKQQQRGQRRQRHEVGGSSGAGAR